MHRMFLLLHIKNLLSCLSCVSCYIYQDIQDYQDAQDVFKLHFKNRFIQLILFILLKKQDKRDFLDAQNCCSISSLIIKQYISKSIL